MIYLSKEGKKQLEKKIDAIDQEIIDTYRMMGESTKIDNDLRENPEYLDLQTKVSYKLPHEKNKLKEVLRNSLILEDQDFYKNFDGETVIVGAKVTLLYNGDKEEYSIVGYGQDDPFNNVIIYNCDFANSLLGKKKGEQFQYKNSTIKILKIELINNY